MGLKVCSECEHQVSDKRGSVCPGCGAPNSAQSGGVLGHQAVAVSIAVLGVATFVFAPAPYGPFVGGLMMIIGLIASLT